MTPTINMSKEAGDCHEIAKMLVNIPQVNDIFTVLGKVGEGTFSKVYRAQIKGSNIVNSTEFALKYLVPTSRPSRIASELQCLKDVGGSRNIVGVEHCMMHKGHVVIVMPYFPHERFADYVKQLKSEDIRNYMKNLFIALEAVHHRGIIHRDVKPNNFLHDRYNKRYALVDFGLAQQIKDTQKSSTSIVSEARSPLKDCNYEPLKIRLNRSEPPLTRENYRETNNVSIDLTKRPYQSTPLLITNKRICYRNQENQEQPSKKKSLFEPSIRNDAWQPLSSRVNILPTPPHTPSSTFSNSKSKLKTTKITIGKELADRNMTKKISHRACLCFGKETVCKICLSREAEEAPRGGTPGFRAPEVLLKHRDQSTAIDIWSAGVILLCILSHKYPFFRADDDLTALTEIVYIVGIKELKDAALSIGKSIALNFPKSIDNIGEVRSQMSPSVYLRALCSRIRLSEGNGAMDKGVKHISSKGTFQKLPFPDICASVLSDYYNNSISDYPHFNVPDTVYDLLNRLLDPNPHTRITASDALNHPFIVGNPGL